MSDCPATGARHRDAMTITAPEPGAAPEPVKAGRSFDRPTLIALVAGDTFTPIAERITRLFSHDRHVVVLRRFVHLAGTSGGLRSEAGLGLDPSWGVHPSDAIVTRVTSRGGGQPRTLHFEVHLDHCVEVALNCVEDTRERDLHEVWDRREAPVRNQTVTKVYLRGRGIHANRDDRIDIEHWNSHGVGHITTVIFEGGAA